MKKQSSAVIAIITVCSAFYLWELLDPSIIDTFSLQRMAYLQGTNEWYRLFTVALMHDTSSTLPFHLAFNMMALHQMGTPLEYVFGRAKFLAIFFNFFRQFWARWVLVFCININVEPLAP